jgi:hypothetical protein
MKALVYAGYMAIFMMGSTAAFGPRDIMYASLTPDWVLGFIVIFVGGLIAARLKRPFLRIASMTISAGLAWEMIEAGIAYWPYYSIGVRQILSDILMFRFISALMAGWGLILATIAEIIWRSPGFGRYSTPASRSGGA